MTLAGSADRANPNLEIEQSYREESVDMASQVEREMAACIENREGGSI